MNSNTSLLWDAGDLACGELLIELRKRLAAKPGQLCRLIALDPAAPQDIPSWCRLTGHILERRDEATSSYFIRARGVDGSVAPIPAHIAPSYDENEVYNPTIFQLARSLPGATTLEGPDVTSEAVSKVCGSRISLDINVSDGIVTGYAHRIKACLFGRASAAVVAREISGTALVEIAQVAREMRTMLEGRDAGPSGRWSDLCALAPMRILGHRKESALLVFAALEKAIGHLQRPN